MNNIPDIAVKLYAHSAQRQKSVADLIVPIQRDEYGIPITLKDQPDLLEIETFYQRGKGNFWTALHEGEVIGTIALLDIGQDRAALRKMFVKKEFRGGQYAVSKRLLDKAFIWAQQQGLAEVWLGTTPAFVAAHRFYEKNGFAEVNAEMLPPGFPVMEVDKKFYKRIV
ncbi:GNAT family N-acetyltransferase [Saccharibacillus sacchari]|uniref:GNAT family N-acetyltransferase n=1 Tax=Saccharibacillus sacchari TaxID=456493 RepID=A0ACC6PCX6_9BACL